MTDFKNNPGVLDDMRMCLVFMAKLKGVKLKQNVEEYDMLTMLDMFHEMEAMPRHYTFKERIANFKNDVLIFAAGVLMKITVGLLFITGKIFGGDAEIEAQRILADLKQRKEKHNHGKST